jgi:hypothetical protein
MSDGASISSNLLCISFVRHQTDALFFSDIADIAAGMARGLGPSGTCIPAQASDDTRSRSGRRREFLPGCSKKLIVGHASNVV